MKDKKINKDKEIKILKEKIKELEKSEIKRKQAEKNLQISDLRLKMVGKASGVVVWDWDLITNELSWSDNYYKIFGYSEVDTLPTIESWSNFIHPNDAEKTLVGIRNVISSKDTSVWKDEYRFKKKNGSYAYTLDWGHVIRDDKGESVRMIGVMLDITEHKQADEKLLKTRERLELAMDAGEHGFWDWNLDTNDVYFSPQYYTMLGYKPGELPMKLETWVDLLHPVDRKTIVAEVENYAKNAQPYEVEFRLKTKGGDWKWISGMGKSYKKDKNGIPHRAVGVHVDITNRKQAEESLKKSEDKYRALIDDVLDTSAVGTFILDPDFKVVWINRKTETFFGLKRDNVIGKDKRQLIQSKIKSIFEDSETFQQKVFNTYDNNTYIENFECHVLAEGDRKDRWLEHWSQPIKSGIYNGGRIEHYSDITERKKAEEELEKHRDHLEELVKERTTELEEVNKELKRFNKLFVGREFRIKELKDKVKDLEKELTRKK